MQRVFQRVFWVGFAIYPTYIQHVFQSVVGVVVFVFCFLPACLVVLGFVSNHLKGNFSRLYSPLPLNFRPDLSGICNNCNIVPMNSFIFDFFQFYMNPLEHIYSAKLPPFQHDMTWSIFGMNLSATDEDLLRTFDTGTLPRSLWRLGEEARSRDFLSGSLNETHFGGIKQWKLMVILRDVPDFFGLVI